MNNSPDLTRDWLQFVSILFWQLLLLAVVFRFRPQIADILERITSVTVGGTKVEVNQREDRRNEISPSTEVKEQLEAFDATGFLSQVGCDQLVKASGLLASGEVIRDSLLLFRTTKQHTWLVAGSQKLFCLLDDANTRNSGKVIQWALPFSETRPIKVRAYKPTVGLLDIGARNGWLYSMRLHPDGDALQHQIERMTEGGKEVGVLQT